MQPTDVAPVTADPLADPLELPCGAVLPNRLAKAAMSEQLGDRANGPTDALVALYERWGAGGAGLLLTGNVMVDRSALGEPRNVVVDDDRDLAMLSRWAQAGQAHGTPVWPQLNHPGRQVFRGVNGGAVAPSAVPLEGAPVFAKPRALTDGEIEAIVERFAVCAAVLQRAGFAGVQLHGAHGYLISQFLSPRTNLREDRWGGPIEHRMRFVLEVVRAVRDAVGPTFGVGIKLNSADFQRGGFTEAESMQVVGALQDASIDLLEVSGGTYESPAMSTGGEVKASTAAREAYFLDYAERVREVAPRVPLMVTGGFRTVGAMRDAVACGATDVAGLGRPLALEPDAFAGLLDGSVTRVSVGSAKVGVKALDAGIDTAWHTRQLQRIGAGKEPDPSESGWKTAAAVVAANGWNAFRRKRG